MYTTYYNCSPMDAGSPHLALVCHGNGYDPHQLRSPKWKGRGNGRGRHQAWGHWDVSEEGGGWVWLVKGAARQL